MRKNEFLRELEKRINQYPDHGEIISYYYELIQDKMDSGMDEDEAVASLGSLDEIVRAIESEKYNAKEESTFRQAVKEEPVATVGASESNGPKRINGGKRFVYVLWVIATVCMCIASISILVIAITFLIVTIGIMGSAFGVAFTSISIGGFQFGMGLFLFGASIIGVHFASVLVRYIFRQKNVWTKNIRKGLAGE